MTPGLQTDPAPTSFLALGDSYTIGEGVAPEGRWTFQLAALLAEVGIELMSPRTIAQTGWTTRELDAAIDAAAPLGEYGFVSVLVGVNDQYRGQPVAGYRREIEALLRRAVGFARGAAGRVLLLSIPDWGVTPFAAADERPRSRIAAEIDAYNAANAEAAAVLDITRVDVTALSRARGMEPGMLVGDGLHPSAAMYREWARLALPAARGLLTVR